MLRRRDAVAHDDPRNASTPQGLRDAGRVARRHTSIDGVHEPLGTGVNERCGGTHSHRALSECDERFVGTRAPRVGRGARARQDERRPAVARGRGVDVLRRGAQRGRPHRDAGFVPETSLPERVHRGEHGHREGCGAPTNRGRRQRGSPETVGDGGPPVPQAREQPLGHDGDAHDERQSHERVELVHVACSGEWTVEEVARRGRERAVHGADVGNPHADDTDEHHGTETSEHDRSVSTRSGACREQPCKADPGEQAARDDRRGALRHDPAALPDRVAFGVDDVGHPVRSAAQDARHGRHGRRDARGLDVIEERVGVAAEHDERAEPPGAAEKGAQGESADEIATTDAPILTQPLPTDDQGEHERTEHGDERRRRVDPAEGGGQHADDTDVEAPRESARTTAGVNGKQQPRHHHPGPRLDGQLSEQTEYPRTQRVQHSRERRSRRPDTQHATREEGGPGGTDDEHERPPGSLRSPPGQAHRVREGEERPHGKQVAVRLVLQFAEPRMPGPGVERAGEVAGRCGNEVDLRVRLDDAGLHQPRQHSECRDDARQRVGEETAQASSPGGRDGGVAHRLRTRTSRFHVTISRRPGTRRIGRAQSGQ